MLEIGIMNRTNISKLSEILEKEKSVEFKYNNLFYQIDESSYGGYVVNLYSSNEKDKDSEYLEKNLVDGGLCSGSASDAVWFMV
ncbi:MAG: hypothetical protein EOM78_22860 [Erysipelotrichia bacterium]|nr:hypothetical protein [Erysipelotrichia bacterium]